MRRISVIIILACLCASCTKQAWHPVGDRIRTEYAEKVSPKNVLAEYPRPQLVRADWQNLNGLWSYAITDTSVAMCYASEGEQVKSILVPFALESSLSGAGDSLTDSQYLWYERSVRVPKKWKGQRIILHFGAVDWQADVWINDQHVGQHKGGFTPFSMDITDALAEGDQKLVVRVYDPTDKGEQPIGKQRLKPHTIWYTPVSGIWQTVWLEPVSGVNYITKLEGQYSMSDQTVTFTIGTKAAQGEVELTLIAPDGSKQVAAVAAGEKLAMVVNNPQLWSADTPTLYDVEVTLTQEGKVVDQVTGYTALREVGRTVDAAGFSRMTVNGKPTFMFGPLDQGWWPDGLYTAPTDAALKSDVELIKRLGMNMIRKHIKVEPARWYYFCDQLGVYVWQDMPSAHVRGMLRDRKHAIGGGKDQPRPDWAKQMYYNEWSEIIDYLRSFQCVTVWVTFNEAWSQFDTEAVVAYTEAYDSTRLVNAASGGNIRLCGSFIDFHHYPAPALNYTLPDYICVCGEYGGLGLPVEGHLWWDKRNWGYAEFGDSEELTARYVQYTDSLCYYISRGMSAAVYTQTSDVEGEVNGFVTYDRKVLKFDADQLYEANTKVINMLQ